jgi:hypothetical protein
MGAALIAAQTVRELGAAMATFAAAARGATGE